jgi:hypothetical protein
MERFVLLVQRATNVADLMVIGTVKHLPHVDQNLVGVEAPVVRQERLAIVVAMVVVGSGVAFV